MDFDAQRQIMVDSQVRVNDVTTFELVTAFLTVPRELFVPKSKQSIAYSEVEIETGPDRALWTVRDLAKLLEALGQKPNDVALVIGAGSGYGAAIIGCNAEAVIALEDTEEAVSDMAGRFAEIGMDQAVAVEAALDKGLPDQGPFDLILIGGMVQTVPDAWLDQLADGGRLGVVVEAGRSLGRARVYVRAGDAVSYRDVFEAAPPSLPGFEAKKSFVF
ncbi:MAG: protein-L-isoaspartate O-methyltransferase [Pseudomonadota bacterium]